MTYQQLQPYPLLTRLSAAIYAGDTELAERILNEAIGLPLEQKAIVDIIVGKRLARPDRLPPLKEGTNLDDCVARYGYHVY